MTKDKKRNSSGSNARDREGDCPLCEKINQCALISNESGSCWCEAIQLPAESGDLEWGLEKLQSDLNSSKKLTLEEVKASKRCVCSSCLIRLNNVANDAK